MPDPATLQRGIIRAQQRQIEQLHEERRQTVDDRERLQAEVRFLRRRLAAPGGPGAPPALLPSAWVEAASEARVVAAEARHARIRDWGAEVVAALRATGVFADGERVVASEIEERLRRWRDAG